MNIEYQIHRKDDLYRKVEMQIRAIGDEKDKGVKASIWDKTGEASDVRLKKPKRKYPDCYEIARQKCKKDQIVYIIKDVTNNSYISLNEEEFFVWNWLDGNTTVADICHHYFIKFKKLSKMPLKLIENLEVKNMLQSKSWNIYDAAKNTQIKNWKVIVGKTSAFFLYSKFSLKNIDNILSVIYNKFAWIFFKPSVIFLYHILIAAGLIVFFTMGYFEKNFAVKNYVTTQFSMVLLFLCSVFPVVLHELAHAFACKKYGRKVNRAGFMLYIGLPVLFVETTDIWMKPKKERIFVSLVGPFTDLLIGSLCFLLHAIFGNIGIFQLFPLVGLIAYIRCVYNFNPLLELDGYYILMDALEIPELRKKSFNFLQKGGIKRLFTTWKLNMEECIFLLYGILAGIYTSWMIIFMIHVWQTQVRSLLIEIWKNKHNSIAAQLLILFAVIVGFIRLLFISKGLYKKFQSFAKHIYDKFLFRKKTT